MIPIALVVGQAHVIDAPDVRRIAVGNGKVIQATAMDNRQVLVVPEMPGRSSLHLWLRRGLQRAYLVDVVASESDRLFAEVRDMFRNEPNLRVTGVGDKILVEGEHVSADQLARVEAIAKLRPEVISLLSPVGVEPMIAMDVRMVEIKRSALERIGVRWNSSAQGPAFGLIGDMHRGAAFMPGGGAAGAALDVRENVRPFSTVFGLATSIASVINLMQQTGDAVVLAEPRLSCRSGGTARFVVGGELPLPVSSGLGAMSVQFKEYGVKFDISPVAGPGGLISAKVSTEISSVDFEVQVREIPGLLKRRAETEVNLNESETLVIAGLVTQESATSVDKVPGLGDLPVLGALFRSRQFRDQNSELVVFITPRIVDSGHRSGLEPASDRSGGTAGLRELRDAGY